MNRGAGRTARRAPASLLRISVSGARPTDARALRGAARAALRAEGYARGRLEIVVVDDAEMSRHHARWMNDPTTTDVLTFDLRESESAGAVDGQIIVCRDVARREAATRGRRPLAELLLYVVHGCLHLAGHDDTRPRDFARMHRREDELLSAMGFGPLFAGFSPPTLRKSRVAGSKAAARHMARGTAGQRAVRAMNPGRKKG